MGDLGGLWWWCGGDGGQADLTERGPELVDLNWWTYRRVLAEVSQEDVTVRWVGEPGAKREKVGLWVGFASSGAGPVLQEPPRGWVSVADVADETGRSLWRVYGPKGSASCQ